VGAKGFIGLSKPRMSVGVIKAIGKVSKGHWIRGGQWALWVVVKGHFQEIFGHTWAMS
jgi:hypothetical protein